MAQGVYRIPKISYAAIAALTNTAPAGAFRGAGRPEATAMLERLMDLAAAELGVDPAEIRRRNFLRPEESRTRRSAARATTAATTTCRCGRPWRSRVTTSCGPSSGGASRPASRGCWGSG
ncbi:molybdopterin cofactor-binding domain-containing protein [Amycolatopsis methanolica]|nr:molybdopterin cofactor-binding domain-containing protein [Amycolatopsis methanolica]